MRIDEAPFSGSYDADDVLFLLKSMPIETTNVDAKERLIQSGRRHYSEMLSSERLPDSTYLDLYEAALSRNSERLAADVASLAAHLAARRPDRPVVILSLARAGTPIGVLLVRTLRAQGHDAVHYSLSIIRGRGIDLNALRYVAARHDPADAVFVDGWTGKGAIASELRSNLSDGSTGFAPTLVVVADPAGQADVAATHDDYLIASGLLNGIVSGLVSRSVLRSDLVGPTDFHACTTYPQYAAADRSRSFVDRVAPMAATAPVRVLDTNYLRAADARRSCENMVQELLRVAGTSDRNRIKPGIAETTRTLLRRMPERILLRDPDEPDVAHLNHLARSAAVPVERLTGDTGYRAAAIILSLGED